MDTAMRRGEVARTQQDAWGECLLPLIPRREVPQALQSELRTIFGIVPSFAYYLAVTPWVARGACLCLRSTSSSISPRAYQLAILAVAQDNSCRFCFSAQRAILKAQGYSDRNIEALQGDFHAADLSDRDLAGLEFIRKVARGSPRPTAADLEPLYAAGYDRAASADLCFLAADSSFTNRVFTLLSLPPETAAGPLGSLARTPLIGFAGPVLLRWVLSRRRRFSYRMPDADGAGLAASVLGEFRGTYAAYLIDQVMRDALESTVLPRRTKLLMMAVVAKGVGCAVGTVNATRALESEGFRAGDVEEVLTHLASPRIDALEARLVLLARETVRYQSRSLQRHMADATQGLPPEQVCEIAGTLALANALCRLTVVLECSPSA